MRLAFEFFQLSTRLKMKYVVIYLISYVLGSQLKMGRVYISYHMIILICPRRYQIIVLKVRQQQPSVSFNH